MSKVQEWLKREQKPSLKDPNYQSGAFRNYISFFELLFVDPDTNLICYKELMPNGDHIEKKICLPLSLMFVAFHLSHFLELSGHLSQMKTIANLKRYFFFPGMFKWVTVLINDCHVKRINKNEKIYTKLLFSLGEAWRLYLFGLFILTIKDLFIPVVQTLNTPL